MGSLIPECSVHGTTRAVDRLCHARKTGRKLDCHVPVRVITGCKASRNVRPGDANFIDSMHDRHGPQPILHRVLPRLCVTRSSDECPTSPLLERSEYTVHSRRLGGNIHLCSNSSDTGTKLFDTFTPCVSSRSEFANPRLKTCNNPSELHVRAYQICYLKVITCVHYLPK